jgi:predicted acetyltransferase
VPELVAPTTSVHTSFLEAMAEFEAEGRSGADDHSMLGEEIRINRDTWHDADAFAAYTQRLRADALDETPRPTGWVPCTTLWYVEGSEYLGRLAIRHRLTEWLLEVGGHIGYDVRPSARRQGHATAMLRAALPVAYGLRIHPLLITCDADNVASRKVIEANGGHFTDEREGKLRFWVPTYTAT